MDDKPIKGLDIPVSSAIEPPSSPIPRRKKSAVEPAPTNGHLMNGKKSTSDNIVNLAGKKRTVSQALEDDSPTAKRTKNQSNGNGTNGDDDLIIVEDSADGAILIDG
jgi:hypothetical protein